MQLRGLKLGELSLDKQQVEAVVACEDSQLVLASAGSGKTMSLLAKIEYLVRDLKLRPEAILAISFTKKTVDELIERCVIRGVEFRTFHSLGNNILKSYKSDYLACRKLMSEEEIASYLRGSILRACKDRDFARKLNDYILFYLSTPVAPGVYRNISQKIKINRLYLRTSILNDQRRNEFESRRKKCTKQSLALDHIRDKEDELVANWLYIYQLPYEYRKDLGGYRPDFVISGLCLDIFAVDQDGNSLLGYEYQKELVWRRKFYRRKKLRNIELQSWQ